MSNKPFFSIVVPTKNRHEEVDMSIKSFLLQTFVDFELIIIDNSDNNLTYNIVNKYSDSRIKYYKTGGLYINENWNFGLQKASGKFVNLSNDKISYYPFALYEIYNIINSNLDVEIFTWMVDTYNTSNGINYITKYNDTDKSEIIKSEIINKDFSKKYCMQLFLIIFRQFKGLFIVVVCYWRF